MDPFILPQNTIPKMSGVTPELLNWVKAALLQVRSIIPRITQLDGEDCFFRLYDEIHGLTIKWLDTCQCAAKTQEGETW
jgi:hypothetical protein